MPTTLVTAPAVQPVTVAQAKENLRITHDDEDDLISDLIDAAARFMVDNDSICLMHQTWRYYVSDVRVPIRITRFPISAVSTAIGYDSAGQANVLDNALIHLDGRVRPAELTFDDAAIGSTADNGADVDIVFGYGDTPVEVPDTLKRALLALVTHWYAFRADVAAKDQPVSLPDSYTRLVAPYRSRGMGA